MRGPARSISVSARLGRPLALGAVRPFAGRAREAPPRAFGGRGGRGSGGLPGPRPRPAAPPCPLLERPSPLPAGPLADAPHRRASGPARHMTSSLPRTGEDAGPRRRPGAPCAPRPLQGSCPPLGSDTGPADGQGSRGDLASCTRGAAPNIPEKGPSREEARLHAGAGLPATVKTTAGPGARPPPRLAETDSPPGPPVARRARGPATAPRRAKAARAKHTALPGLGCSGPDPLTARRAARPYDKIPAPEDAWERLVSRCICWSWLECRPLSVGPEGPRCCEVLGGGPWKAIGLASGGMTRAATPLLV
eukprot:scaffold707_cov399-Prasinococcus_capsulatus_cf.AAC.39